MILIAAGIPALHGWADQVFSEDIIIRGNLAVGFNAIVNEDFGNDVIRLKDTSLRLHFDDTSSTQSFPANDWRIVINDTANGGGNYFGVEDATAGRIPFRVEAGAPLHSLFVRGNGDVGLNTSTPLVELHVVDGDSTVVRLEQNGSAGWPPQIWDMGGNETNFFVRDVSNGSVLPFKIRPDSPNNQLVVTSVGVAIGKANPDANALLHVDADGALGQQVVIGPSAGNGADAMLAVAGSGYFENDLEVGSSRALKEGITGLEPEEARSALEGLEPVHFRYLNRPGDRLGFIAEDVPDLVASDSRKSLSPMDFIAVLTSVVKEQQEEIAGLRSRLEELEKAAPEAR